MVAPDLLNAEVLSVVRKLEQNGTLSAARATQASINLARAPLRRVPTLPFVTAVWALRANLTPYDACYVAVARALSCPLVTADARLARAPGLGLSVVVV